MPFSTEPPRQRLNREQLAELIRANIAAFKEDPNFYDYLTELVIYLMQYEYDWQVPSVGGPNSVTATKQKTGGDQKLREYRFQFIQPLELQAKTAVETRLCRMCGADMAGKVVCPNCRGRNRID